MVAEKVEELAALGVVLEPVQAGEFALAGGVRFEFQVCRTPGRGRRHNCGTGILIRNDLRRRELVGKRRSKQDLFGKFAEFHAGGFNSL